VVGGRRSLVLDRLRIQAVMTIRLTGEVAHLKLGLLYKYWRTFNLFQYLPERANALSARDHTRSLLHCSTFQKLLISKSWRVTYVIP